MVQLNFRNMRLGNTEHLPDFGLTNFASKQANRGYLLWSKSSVAIAYALCSLRIVVRPMSSFSCHVSDVVSLSACKKMRWSNAKRDITRMTNKQAISNRAVVNPPAKSMHESLPCSISAIADDAISVSSLACPQPTCVGLFDTRPEANFYRDYLANVYTFRHQSRPVFNFGQLYHIPETETYLIMETYMTKRPPARSRR